jgi:hypothetical protein
MKRLFIISIILSICGIVAMAQDPVSSHQSTGRDRLDYMTDFRQPTVSYDDGMIIISNGNGLYHAVLTSLTTQFVVIDMIIDGDEGEIDIAFLEDGKYMLALTGSAGITYRWTIDKGGIIQIDPYGFGVSPQSGVSNRNGIWHRFYEY